jgi:hypothetical protein
MVCLLVEGGVREPLDNMECVGSEAFGLSKTSYCALSETTSADPAFKFFVTSWTIGLINGYFINLTHQGMIPPINLIPTR